MSVENNNDAVNITTKGKDEVFCSDCASVISKKAEICPKCGVRQKPSLGTATETATSALNKKTPKGRNKWVAIIIAFFFGFLGGHKFYLGKTLHGVLYLLFCWSGITALLAIFDIIMLLMKTEEEFEKIYG